MSLQRQVGAAGENIAVFGFDCMQVADALPTSSNPLSHEYVAASPTELPDKVTSPLVGSVGSAQRAEK